VAFQHNVLSKLERGGTNVWDYTKSILAGLGKLPTDYAESLAPACIKWRQIPARHDLLALLARITMDRHSPQVPGELRRGVFLDIQ
jgi:hypothetical protein